MGPRPFSSTRAFGGEIDSQGMNYMTLLDSLTLTLESGKNTVLGGRSFVVFVDETGHKLLRDPQYPLFGLGGCGVLVANYRRFVVDPWLKLKEQYFGACDKPLHASSLHQCSQEQLDALAGFFRENHFSRVAALVTDKTALLSGITPYRISSSSLMARVAKVAGKWNRSKIVLIFEESARGDKLAVRYFDKYKKCKVINQEREWCIPVEKYLMPKSSMEAGLEVADFIMHAAGGQVRAWRQNQKVPARRDFVSVFKNVDEKLVSFFEIVKVEANRSA